MRAGGFCPAAWRTGDGAGQETAAAGRQQRPGDSSRETAADGCSWHSGNRHSGQQVRRQQVRRQQVRPVTIRFRRAEGRGFPAHRNCRHTAGIRGTSRNHPDMPGLSLLKQKEAPSTGASFLFYPTHTSGKDRNAGTYSYWPDLSRSTSSRERKRQAPRLRFFLVRPA